MAIFADPKSTFYTKYRWWLKEAAHDLRPTQNTKTHNNQHELPPPYLPADLPSTSMGRSEAPPTHGAAAPEVPTQGVGAGCALDAVSSPVWGIEQRPIEKYRDERGVGLRWPPLIRNTQQSTESLCL